MAVNVLRFGWHRSYCKVEEIKKETEYSKFFVNEINRLIQIVLSSVCILSNTTDLTVGHVSAT